MEVQLKTGPTFWGAYIQTPSCVDLVLVLPLARRPGEGHTFILCLVYGGLYHQWLRVNLLIL